MDTGIMFRSRRSCCRWLVLLLVVLAVAADQEAHQEQRQNFGYRQRQGRTVEEAADDNVVASLKKGIYTVRHEQGQVGERSEQNQGDVEEESAGTTARVSSQQQRRPPVVEESPEDSYTGASSSYSMVHPGTEQRGVNPMRYKTVLVKKLKNYPRTYRPSMQSVEQNYKNYRNPENYKYQNSQMDSPSRPPPQEESQVEPVQGDQIARVVHPSIMQSLLKQQPQTFDNPQEKEEERLEEDPPTDWQTQHQQNENSRQSHKSYKAPFTLKNERHRESVDMSKRPIYVPNRVSVQNPSSDSSFNVGYSIGFGNAVAQPLKAEPPAGLRQAKEMPYPTSYQNTPVNVHVDGQKTYWKNMGSGVEMSQHVETKTYYPKEDGASNQNGYSSGSVVNQPLYFKDGFDHSFSSSSSGPNSFDHNHALQQSNPFDFSNAINPSTNLPYSSKFNQSPKSHFTYSMETFPKQSSLTSFSESKPYHSHYLDTFTKSNRPPYVEQQQQQQEQQQQHDAPSSDYSSSQNIQSSESTGESQAYEGLTQERPQYEKLNYQYNSLRSGHSINFSPKPRTIDLHKSTPSVPQSKYMIKPVASGINHINEDLYGANYGFPALAVAPQMYSLGSKSAPGGMVQAILVPVNTPTSSFPYSMGMPVMGNGYSPYFGHPIGVLRVPEPVSGSSPIPAGHEPNYDPSVPVEPQIYHPTFQRSPAKFVHSHSMMVKHHRELPAESSQYFFQKTPHQSSLRTEELSDQPLHPTKFKALHPTDAPSYPTQGVKYVSSTPTHSSLSSYSSTPSEALQAQPSSSLFSHPPRHYRDYRGGSMIFVKRV